MKEWKPDFKKEPTPKKLFKQNSLKKKREPSGELPLFKKYAMQMGCKSEISGEYIPDITVSNVAHILSKKQYPEFRLKTANYCIMTADEHREYDQGSEGYLRTLPEWKWFFEKKERLLAEYKNLEK